MVQFVDGSTSRMLAADMTLPIALGLSWPDRLRSIPPALEHASSWTFEPLDDAAFQR